MGGLIVEIRDVCHVGRSHDETGAEMKRLAVGSRVLPAPWLF